MGGERRRPAVRAPVHRGLVLLRSQPIITATDAELVAQFATGQDLPGVIGGLYLAPFAGIMFLWFVAVIRDQIGSARTASSRPSSSAAACSSWPSCSPRRPSRARRSSASATWARRRHRRRSSARPRALSYTLLFAFGTRAAAVFMIATATIGIKSGTFPRWFAWTGYLLGVVLLLAVAFWDWVILVLPPGSRS